tara:strand:+ start:2235 stop:2831 length:597 start_codon:yes stop_codon:yes gene_type:complete
MKFKIFNLKKYFLHKTISIFFLAGLYAYSTPYIAILSLKNAIETNNVKKAEKYINFPSLQTDLEHQIMIAFKDNLFSDSSAIAIPEIGLLVLDPFLKNVINSIVSATVTPQGLNLLLTKGQISKEIPNRENIILDSNKEKINPNIKLYYHSFNEFILRSDISGIKERIKFRFIREGLTHWRLASVKIPITQLSNQIMK